MKGCVCVGCGHDLCVDMREQTYIGKDDSIILTFISHTLIRHSNLVNGSLLMVFMCAGVYVLAAGVGKREHAYIRILSLTHTYIYTQTHMYKHTKNTCTAAHMKTISREPLTKLEYRIKCL